MLTKIKRLIKLFRFVWNGEGLEVDELQQRITRAEMDIMILIKSMKSVLLAVDERVCAIASLGHEMDVLMNLDKQHHAFQRMDHTIQLCKEVSDLKELLEVTYQMFEVNKDR